ncbi:MAG: hypothetical protein GX387_03110 [Clostridium sp.]|nr:hypothetical protein [Clostridium sp.]
MDEITNKREVDENKNNLDLKNNIDLIERSPKPSEGNGVLSKIMYLIIIILVSASIIALVRMFISDLTNKDPLISKFKTYEKPTIKKTPAKEPFIINKEGIEYEVLPMAEYRLFGRMVAKNRYPDGFDLAVPISPYDIGIVHGKLAMHSSIELFKFDFGNRCLIYSYDAVDHPFTTEEMYLHIENVHAIHGNDRILEAIEKVEAGQFIILEGDLVKVYISAKYGGDRALWESSLVQGTNECKVMYITKITLGDEVYE